MTNIIKLNILANTVQDNFNSKLETGKSFENNLYELQLLQIIPLDGDSINDRILICLYLSE